jgi:tetratricopeptide (TPR) repeat protein
MRVFFVFAIAIGLLIYSTGLWAPYHLDDPNVVKIAEKTFGWSTRPLGFASFWLNRQILIFIGSVLPWREPFYYRLGNILIHALAATALFWFVREITARWIVAATAGALFLVHPIQTQAVTYITQRFESQAAMFMLFSAAAYARFRRTGAKGWIVPVVLFAIGAGLTKETAVVLPLWLLFVELVFFEATRIRQRAVYMAVLGLVLAIPAWRAFEGSGERTLGWIPWDRYFLTQGPILTKYFQLATWPRQQFLFYDFQPVSVVTWQVALQWLLVLAVIGLGLYLLKRNRLIGFGIVSFFIFLLPVMLLPLPDLINEHRLYGAFAGVAIAAAGCAEAVNQKWARRASATARSRKIWAAGGILIVALAVKTARRNSDWNDQLTFLELHHTAFPQDPEILSRLASYYYSSGYVNRSIELNLEARRYEGRYNTYYSQEGRALIAINLSSAYLAKNNLEAAKAEARKAIATKPDEPLAWRALGYVQLQARDFKEAEKSFQKYESLRPNEDSWEAVRMAAVSAGDVETANKAKEWLKLDETKTYPEQQTGIPKQYRGFAIFALTMALLIAIASAVWIVWSAVSPLLRLKSSISSPESNRYLP